MMTAPRWLSSMSSSILLRVAAMPKKVQRTMAPPPFTFSLKTWQVAIWRLTEMSTFLLACSSALNAAAKSCKPWCPTQKHRNYKRMVIKSSTITKNNWPKSWLVKQPRIQIYSVDQLRVAGLQEEVEWAHQQRILTNLWCRPAKVTNSEREKQRRRNWYSRKCKKLAISRGSHQRMSNCLIF